MSSMKCPQCGLVNWSTAEACKRCRLPINGAEAPGETQWEQDSDGFVAADPNQWNPNGGYQSAPYSYSGYGDQPRKSGLAIASLVIGIISMLACGLLGLGSITGLVLGIVALTKVKNSPAEYSGQGFAVAGVVLSVVSLFFAGIVLSIAIPNLYASIRAANESSAIRKVKLLAAAESTYFNGAGRYGTLQDLAAAGLVDAKLSRGVMNSYMFEVRTNGKSYEVLATPVRDSDVGSRSFYLSSDEQVIRAAKKGGVAATAYDPPLNPDAPPQYRQTNQRETSQPAYSPAN